MVRSERKRNDEVISYLMNQLIVIKKQTRKCRNRNFQDTGPFGECSGMTRGSVDTDIFELKTHS